LHKEKEMADFRKWLFALAVVALLAGFTVPASAQSNSSANLASPGLSAAQATGIVEFVSDVVLTHTLYNGRVRSAQSAEFFVFKSFAKRSRVGWVSQATAVVVDWRLASSFPVRLAAA